MTFLEVGIIKQGKSEVNKISSPRVNYNHKKIAVIWKIMILSNYYSPGIDVLFYRAAKICDSVQRLGERKCWFAKRKGINISDCLNVLCFSLGEQLKGTVRIGPIGLLNYSMDMGK